MTRRPGRFRFVLADTAPRPFFAGFRRAIFYPGKNCPIMGLAGRAAVHFCRMNFFYGGGLCSERRLLLKRNAFRT
jgi:hypothetical protein